MFLQTGYQEIGLLFGWCLATRVTVCEEEASAISGSGSCRFRV